MGPHLGGSRQAERARGRVLLGEKVVQSPVSISGKGIRNSGRAAPLLHQGPLPEVRSHGFAGGDKACAQHHTAPPGEADTL